MTDVPNISEWSERPTPQKPEKKKHHVFLWFFLTIQAIFVVWIIGGMSTANTGGDAAKEVGTAIGVALIFGLWMGVDFILGLTYGIYKLATRK